MFIVVYVSGNQVAGAGQFLMHQHTNVNVHQSLLLFLKIPEVFHLVFLFSQSGAFQDLREKKFCPHHL